MNARFWARRSRTRLAAFGLAAAASGTVLGLDRRAPSSAAPSSAGITAQLKHYTRECVARPWLHTARAAEAMDHTSWSSPPPLNPDPLPANLAPRLALQWLRKHSQQGPHHLPGLSTRCPVEHEDLPELHERVGALYERHTIDKGAIAWIESNQYRANTPRSEDTFAVRTQLAHHPGQLVGVFDGHAGAACSDFCKEELFDFIEWTDQERFDGAAKSGLLGPMAFHLADLAFIERCWREHRVSDGIAGACAVVCHISTDQTAETAAASNGTDVAGSTAPSKAIPAARIDTAWVGDCRAVVGRRVDAIDEETGLKRSGWRPIALTKDHQIDDDPNERERMLAMHPYEPDAIYHSRIKGGLQPTRAFGDAAYKDMRFVEQWAERRERRKTMIAKTGWSPPYATCQPAQTQYELHPDDEFLVLASDGLFQDLHNEEVVRIVGHALAQAEEAARHGESTVPLGLKPAVLLTEQALVAAMEAVDGRWAQGVSLSKVLDLPNEKKRRTHDDVTVLVVKLRGAAGGAAPSGKTVKVPPTLVALQQQQQLLTEEEADTEQKQ